MKVKRLKEELDPIRLKSMEDSYWKDLNEMGELYPEIKKLLKSYRSIEAGGKFSKEFLDGYLAAIGDLKYIKKLL
jgi:hypothetical protein